MSARAQLAMCQRDVLSICQYLFSHSASLVLQKSTCDYAVMKRKRCQKHGRRAQANDAPEIVANKRQKCESSETKRSNLCETKNAQSSGYKCLQAAIESQCALTPLLDKNIGESWFEALKEEFAKPYFKKLSDFIESERRSKTIYPLAKDVFSWTRHCSIDEVKVVILGQDPYHGPNQAHGLCFSVQPGVVPPPSLKNIYKELENDIEAFKTPDHGCLIGWANQGVLLLNAVLTVRAHSANSHKDMGWEQFTAAVLRTVSKRNKGIVFLLWGAPAQKMTAHIDKSVHHMLNAAHPSPLSAHRGFFGCHHFSLCNERLKKQGKTPVDWTRLPC